MKDLIFFLQKQKVESQLKNSQTILAEALKFTQCNFQRMIFCLHKEHLWTGAQSNRNDTALDAYQIGIIH